MPPPLYIGYDHGIPMAEHYDRTRGDSYIFGEMRPGFRVNGVDDRPYAELPRRPADYVPFQSMFQPDGRHAYHPVTSRIENLRGGNGSYGERDYNQRSMADAPPYPRNGVSRELAMRPGMMQHARGGGVAPDNRGGYGGANRGGYGADPRGGFGAYPRAGFVADPQGGFGVDPRGGNAGDNRGSGFAGDDRGAGFVGDNRGNYGRPVRGSNGRGSRGGYHRGYR